jgi:putative DNA primase/helicase
VLVAEGYSTAATLHEVTGLACAVAFDCGNLDRVACAIRKARPGVNIAVCGDDDWATKGNPGRRAAERAARMAGGRIVLPGPWPGNRGPKDTDFNDLARLAGRDAVRSNIASVVKGVS